MKEKTAAISLNLVFTIIIEINNLSHQDIQYKRSLFLRNEKGLSSEFE